MIVTYALIFAFAAVSLSLLLTMIRLVKGPRSGDRILALDTLSINAVALIILVGIAGATQIYFEAAMIIAMLGFISTVAVARFVLRGDIIE
ncbi:MULTISPECIES: K+/H+ antiporter subunit F [Roseobacteraceae]|uniref:K+/H+ antiporter subunit F n=1 Tax=Roseobacteraceae TaxID=2854170 RepID=UPI0019448B59|nr:MULTISPECIES: K+/H+ antiporter subunit F [Roseobacteraceae]